jgi:hypothetical protein
VTTVQWWVNEDCGYTDHGTTHLNLRINRSGRFNGTDNHSVPGWLGGSSWGQHIWGRLTGTTATVTVDDYSSGQSQSICDGQHTFHATDSALDQGRG